MKDNNIFKSVASCLKNSENVVLLGAPSVGKTYELINTLIPKLNEENIKVVFITVDELKKEYEDKINEEKANSIIYYEQLNKNEFSNLNFSDKVVIIDDFYKVYMKCKENKEILIICLKF